MGPINPHESRPWLITLSLELCPENSYKHGEPDRIEDSEGRIEVKSI